MSDNKWKSIPQDVRRINVHEDHEVQYWVKKFGVSADELKAAVKKVGIVSKNVEKELRGEEPPFRPAASWA